MNKNNIIGLIGGMGPYASAYFYKLLLKKSSKEYGATNNDDFPEIVIDSVPVPDFISDTKQLGKASNMLASRIKRLNDFGCSTIAIVCNTSHLLYPNLTNASGANIVSIIDLVSKKIEVLKMANVGLFATETTIKTKLYHEALIGTGIQIFVPDKNIQEMQEKIIRDVIAHGETRIYEEKLQKMTKKFIKDKNLDGVILGCTELPLVFPKDKFNIVIDCLDVLADSLLANFYQR